MEWMQAVSSLCRFKQRVAVVLVGVALAGGGPLAPTSTWADDKPPSGNKADSAVNSPARVLASVGDELILQADVDLALERTASGRSNLPAMPEPVLMAAVDLIARRRQALETLKKQNKSVSQANIDKWLLDNSPPELKLTAQQALNTRAEAAKTSPESYRNFLAFRLSWQAYLQTVVNEKNLEKHFQNQKSRFDGTKFQIEIIHLPVPPGKSEQRAAAHSQLAKTRTEVLEGKLSLAEAIKQLADKQLADKQLADKQLADKQPADKEEQATTDQPLWITGTGPLMPTIVDYAIKTPKGELSQPFDSATGVHLLRVLEIQPGQQTMQEAQNNVRSHMLLYLLDFLASQSSRELPLVWLAK